jgi:3-oxoacyl-[acyl-carrier protein] reductase
MQKLTDKVAIITGASRGLGKAMAIELAKEGASVAVAARTVEAGQGPLPGTIHETVETIKKRGGEARAIKCDVTDENDVTAMVRQVMKHYGRIDILINNAGITTPEPFLKLTTKKWDLVIAVNLKGTFLCSQAVLPHMVEQKRGHQSSHRALDAWIGQRDEKT